MAKFLLIICFLQLLRFTMPLRKVCREAEIYTIFRSTKLQNAMEVELWNPPSTWRSLLKSLEGCTEYHGHLLIRDPSAGKSKFGENVRHQDLYHLKNIKVIYGPVYLNLNKYPEIKNLSFLSNLRAIHAASKLGFGLVNSRVEMFDLRDLELDVYKVTIAHNKELCYLENFRTVNPSAVFAITDNKDRTLCADEGYLCSDACNPKKGCWGPSGRHCFECKWKAGDDCVSSCSLTTSFFTPSKGRVCGRCHRRCQHGCFGPLKTQCRFRPGLNDFCLKHMFLNTRTGHCEECSKKCLGAGFANRSQLIVAACTGPGSTKGLGGCSFGCTGNTFLTISSNGLPKCAPCHPGCRSSCRNARRSGCLRVKESNNGGKMTPGLTFFVSVILPGSVVLAVALLALSKRCRSSVAGWCSW